MAAHGVEEDLRADDVRRHELLGAADDRLLDVRLRRGVDDRVGHADEEVAEAKAQAEKATLEAKWAKIGRKPNEFKEGDIVRVTDRLGAMGLYVGFITEIAAIGPGPHPLVIGTNEIHYYAEVELITPVESRFDRA